VRAPAAGTVKILVTVGQFVSTYAPAALVQLTLDAKIPSSATVRSNSAKASSSLANRSSQTMDVLAELTTASDHSVSCSSRARRMQRVITIVEGQDDTRDVGARVGAQASRRSGKFGNELGGHI
jgi:hypothetical protein